MALIDLKFNEDGDDLIVILTNHGNTALDPETAKAHHTQYCRSLYDRLVSMMKQKKINMTLSQTNEAIKAATKEFYMHAVNNDAIYVPPRTITTLNIFYLSIEPFVEVIVDHEQLPFKLHLVK